MSLKWRDLRSIEDKLKKDPTAVFVVSVALGKFAKRSAYWLDIYHSPKSKWGNAYFVCRQWSFMRDGQLVEGSVASERFGTPGSAISEFEELYSKKVKDGWKLNDVNVSDSILDVNLQLAKSIANLVNMAPTAVNAGAESKVEEEVKAVRVKTRHERMVDLQNKRKSKAPW